MAWYLKLRTKAAICVEILNFGEIEREMSKIPISKSLPFCSQLSLLFVFSLSLQFIPGITDDSTSSKNGTKADNHATSKSNTGPTIFAIFLALVAIALFVFFLIKVWQKKKREEQHARLLKLFEQDDELEVELGLRD